MNVSELPNALNLETVQDAYEDVPITGAYTSDLLSDVMAHAHDTQVLITIQAHKNTIAVATLVGVTAIIVCNGRPIPEDMKEAAREEQIALFVGSQDQFTVSGVLYELLQHG